MPVSLGYDLWELIEAINSERTLAKCDYGLDTGLIFGIKRGRNIDTITKMIEAGVEAFEKELICAIDINGDELAFPIKTLSECFNPALVAGCPLTLHAGEWDGPQSVRDAIECGAKRIGHGVRAYEDAKLVEMLSRSSICLEICPTSNIRTQVYASLDKHPLRKLFEAGVTISINSDDHGIFGSDIDEEYVILENKFGFSPNDFKKINESAINSAFISEVKKKNLIKLNESAFNNFLLDT